MGGSKKKQAKLTPEQREEKRDQKDRRKYRKHLENEFHILVKQNPSIKYILMEKEFGIKMPEYDPVKELENVVTAKAIEMINRDRDLQEQLALAFINNKASDIGLAKDPPEDQLEKLKERLLQMKETMDLLGIKNNPSIWDAFKDPKLMPEVVKLVNTLIASRQPATPAPAPDNNTTYMVEIDDKIVEMNAEEYKAYSLLRNKYKVTQNAETPKAGEVKAPAPEAASIDLSKTKIVPDKNSNN